MTDIYDTAVREWVARRVRHRGHNHVTRSMVSKPRFGIDEGWPGSDVTPADDPEPCVVVMLDNHQHTETVTSVTTFLQELPRHRAGAGGRAVTGWVVVPVAVVVVVVLLVVVGGWLMKVTQ